MKPITARTTARGPWARANQDGDGDADDMEAAGTSVDNQTRASKFAKFVVDPLTGVRLFAIIVFNSIVRKLLYTVFSRCAEDC